MDAPDSPEGGKDLNAATYKISKNHKEEFTFDVWLEIDKLINLENDPPYWFHYNKIDPYRSPENFVNALFDENEQFSISKNIEFYKNFFNPSTFTTEERQEIVKQLKTKRLPLLISRTCIMGPNS